MSKIYIQPVEEATFDSFFSYAKENDFNMEIASFAFSDILDSNWMDILKNIQRKLRGFKGEISIHGAFMELVIHSRDKKIREVAKSRIYQNLEIAKMLNAKYIVFHGNFNPFIRHESYVKNWIEQNAIFWSDALGKFDIIVVLENLWEPSPTIFRELLDNVNNNRLKVCFDTGHVNLFSVAPLKEWFDVLGDDIVYMHINDNKGDFDSELIPGEGSINWKSFSKLIEEYRMEPVLVFEVGTLEKADKSIMYFKKNNFYPFNG
jgi:sugar phosphate isomerase/epimerase